MYNRIAYVKTGWSDTYQGGAVFGRHDYITEYEDAHERFNFLPGPDGRYYGYIPPIGKKYRPPQPEKSDGWLIIFVAAERGQGPLTVVGWYDHAQLEDEYQDRPEYGANVEFETDVEDVKFMYCIVSDSATLIPTADRTITISGKHFRRSPIVYVRGTESKDTWRTELAKFAVKMVKTSERVFQKAGMPSVNFPDAKHRKKVEKAAINAVRTLLGRKGYNIRDRQKDYCGYDLLATRKRQPKELHIEVKGTSTSEMQFFMTENERNYMNNPKWRLAIVTSALTRPNVNMLNANQTQRAFNFSPIAWSARKK